MALRPGDWVHPDLDPHPNKTLKQYVQTNNVVLPSRTPFETLEDQLPPRVPVDEGWPPLIFNKPFVPPPGGVEATRPQKPGSPR